MLTLARWLLTIVGTVFALLVLGTVVPRPLFDVAAGEELGGDRILVFASYLHTDIAVPVEVVREDARFDFLRGASLPLDHPNARWVLFGWGGKAFYTATPQLSDIRLGPVLKSFTLDSSVMHVEIVGPIDGFIPTADFMIAENGLGRLLDFVRASFAGSEPVQVPGAGYGDNDAFYEAVSSFNAIVGCNTWTAAALREAGLRTGWWNPIPGTLAYSLALYN